MKKTLLMAAAALAAGVISVQAQVYSQNIVGYANVPIPNLGQMYSMTVPFKIGASNGANEVFTSLPDGSSIMLWDGVASTFKTYYKDVNGSTITGWADGDGNPDVAPPILPVGLGFFVSPAASNYTNTFAGAIAINVGTSNVMQFPNLGQLYLVGSVVPYSGSVTNGNNSTGGVNLNSIPDGSSVMFWDGVTTTFKTYYRDINGSTITGWADGDGNPDVAPPQVVVGQAFFISSSTSNGTWITGL